MLTSVRKYKKRPKRSLYVKDLVVLRNLTGITLILPDCINHFDPLWHFYTSNGNFESVFGLRLRSNGKDYQSYIMDGG